MKYLLEVIAFNIESCLLIQNSGGHRIELCANPAEGGTTPSAGFIKKAREMTSIDLFPIIRPRGGDFLYTDSEFQIMKEDIALCKKLGCDGVVIGLLNSDASIDAYRTTQLVECAYPMEVTFHRAFDRVKDAEQALEVVIQTGCTRILTSGLYPTVLEGQTVLKKLVNQAADRIVIMPGSGLRSSNVREIAQFTQASEFHTSARTLKNSKMNFQSQVLNDDMRQVVADGEEIKNILNQLGQLVKE